MVGKIIKYEIIALFRTLAIIAAVVISAAILIRIGIAADSLDLVVLPLIFFYLGLMALLAWGFIGSVSRFWSSLFKGEGYFTFSLPVTSTQLLVGKFLAALIVEIACALVGALSVLILTVGVQDETLVEILDVVWALTDEYLTYFSSDPLLAVEALVCAFLALPMTLLYFYAVMTLGQTATKHRGVVAFFLYLGISWAVSLVELLLYDPLLTNINDPHYVYMIEIIVRAACVTGLFFLTRYLLNHKVNLVG